MTDPLSADQPLHVLLLKHVPDQTVAFAQVKLGAIAGDDAGRILAPMLVYILMAVILFAKPAGLFGRRA